MHRYQRVSASYARLIAMLIQSHLCRPSLVHKVRFVASTLLDAVRKAETAPDSAARAHAYLCEKVHVLQRFSALIGTMSSYRGFPIHFVRN